MTPTYDPELSRFLDFWRLLFAEVPTTTAARRLGLPADVADRWAGATEEEIEAMLVSRIRRRQLRPM
jgi:hypothetical protein